LATELAMEIKSLTDNDSADHQDRKGGLIAKMLALLWVTSGVALTVAWLSLIVYILSAVFDWIR
jgi:hypothetical protein